jgi:hypothetical protein
MSDLSANLESVRRQLAQTVEQSINDAEAFAARIAELERQVAGHTGLTRSANELAVKRGEAIKKQAIRIAGLEGERDAWRNAAQEWESHEVVCNGPRCNCNLQPLHELVSAALASRTEPEG